MKRNKNKSERLVVVITRIVCKPDWCPQLLPHPVQFRSIETLQKSRGPRCISAFKSYFQLVFGMMTQALSGALSRRILLVNCIVVTGLSLMKPN